MSVARVRRHGIVRTLGDRLFLLSAGGWTLIVLVFAALGLYVTWADSIDLARGYAHLASEMSGAFFAREMEREGALAPASASSERGPRPAGASHGEAGDGRPVAPGRASGFAPVHEMPLKAGRYRIHLTSLKPANPGYAPDPWEARALRSLAEGGREFGELTRLGGVLYFRTMRALVNEPGCVRCHGPQGYREGELRGGISVAVPVQSKWAVTEYRGWGFAAGGLGVVWALGLGGIAFGVRWGVQRRADEAHAEAIIRQSEARYRLLVDSLGEGVGVVDAEERFLFINPAGEQIFGVAAGELVGRSLNEFLSPEQQALVRRETGRRIAGEQSSYEVTITRPDGRQRVLLATVTPQRNERGEYDRALGTFRDLTRRLEAEAARARSEQRYRRLFETSRDALMTLFPPGWEFTSANAATLELFGARNEQEFTSLGPWEVSPEQQPDGEASSVKARRMIDTAMEQGSCFFDWVHRRIDGEVFPATVLLTRVELEGKTGLMATVRDVTEQKRAEAERESLIGELQAALSEVKTLRGLLPICAGCKKIRDEREEWHPVESYVARHTSAQFSHSMCPECIKKYYPEL